MGCLTVTPSAADVQPRFYLQKSEGFAGEAKFFYRDHFRVYHIVRGYVTVSAENKDGIRLGYGDICILPPDIRLRLGSLEPRTVTREFCSRAARLPNLCPHFHLSLQSGCDSVLQRMNRKYDTARFYESVRLLREFFDRPAVTTDLIVGFPGETEDEFAQTLDFIRRCSFSSMHIFPYSRRPGTPAAKMPGQIPNTVKEDRAHRAIALAAQMEQEYLSQWLGKTVPVLFEEERDGLWHGHTVNYIPVAARGSDLHNRCCDVRLERILGDTLGGQII